MSLHIDVFLDSSDTAQWCEINLAYAEGEIEEEIMLSNTHFEMLVLTISIHILMIQNATIVVNGPSVQLIIQFKIANISRPLSAQAKV